LLKLVAWDAESDQHPRSFDEQILIAGNVARRSLLDNQSNRQANRLGCGFVQAHRKVFRPKRADLSVGQFLVDHPNILKFLDPDEEGRESF
jgi:hypothetical protein